MKKCLFTSILSLFSYMLTGQAPFPSAEEIKQFMASRTCVVSDDDAFSPFNTYIKQAMKDYWKLTPFEFIKPADFKIRKSDPAYSFILLTETTFEKDKANSVYDFINLVQGKDVDKIAEMPEICAIPLSASGGDEMEYGYKLGAILLFIQKHAQLIAEDPSLTGRKYLKYYNKNVPRVINKTIFVMKEDLSPAINTIERLKAIYKYKIEIVPEESIVKAIQNKSPNTLILHKVGPAGESNSGYCFKMLIGTDDSEMYYYNQHIIDRINPDGLLPADLKRLSRF